MAVLLNGARRSRVAIALAMVDFAYDVMVETGVDISPLPVLLDEWERPETFNTPALLRNIAAEGVRL